MDEEEPTALGGVPLRSVEAIARRLRVQALGEASLVRRCQTGHTAATLSNLLEGVLRATYGLEESDGTSSPARGAPLLPERAPFPLKLVPTLAVVAELQLRLTTKVMSAVAARPVVTVFELEKEICGAEGVAAFAELGLGHGLQCLPIVQQYFQLSTGMHVEPVTSQHVLEYLLTAHDDLVAGAAPTGSRCVVGTLPSSTTCSSDSDTRTLMNGFRAHYEAHIRPFLPPANGDANAAVSSGAPRRITSNRELGIHIQSLSWLLVTLNQESASRAAAVCAATDHARTTFRRNRRLYTAAVCALDQKLLASTTAGPFTVAMSESEAAETSVPLAFWDSAPGPSGGVQLTFSVGGASPTLPTLAPKLPMTRTMTASVPDTAVGTRSATVAVRARRGGQVIRDQAAPCVDIGSVEVRPPVVIGAPAGASDTAASKAVHPHWSEGGTPAATSAAPLMVATAEAEDNNFSFAEITPLEVLHTYSSSMVEASGASLTPVDVVRRGLSRLAIGQIISVDLLCKTFRRIGSALARSPDEADRFFSDVAEVAFLPIAHPCRTPLDSEGAAMSPTAVKARTMEAIALARVDEIYWSSALSRALLEAPAETQDRVKQFLHTSAAALCFIGDEFMRLLQTRARTAQSVVRPWMLSVGICRRVYRHGCGRAANSDTFTRDFLCAFSFYFESTFAEVFQSHKVHGKSTQEAAAAAARLLTNGTDDGIACTPAFPLNGEWLSGALDGLFYGGPREFGFSQLHLRPEPPSIKELAVLPFVDTQPSYVVDAALTAFGVRSLERSVVRHVSFETLRPGNSQLLLHRAVEAFTPYVQSFLACHDVTAYVLGYCQLHHRLRHLRVVWGRRAQIHERLVCTARPRSGDDCDSSPTYISTRSVRLTYLPSHHTLYGEDGDFSPAVVADALVELYYPLPPVHAQRRVYDDTRALLADLMRAFVSVTDSSASTDGAAWHANEALLTGSEPAVGAALTRALDSQARCFSQQRELHPPVVRFDPASGFSTRTGCGTSSTTEVLPASAQASFVVNAVPSLRPQQHFPPGCDGLSQPAVREPYHRRQPRGDSTMNANTSLTGRRGNDFATVGLTRAASGPPEFQNKWARGEAASALDTALECLQRADGNNESENGLYGRSFQRPRLESGNTESGIKGDHGSDTDSSSGNEQEGILHFRALRKRKAVSTPVAGLFQNPAAVALVRVDGSSSGDSATVAALAAERFIYETVKSEYARYGSGFAVVWMNERGERGTPYDVLVLRRASAVASSAGGDREHYECGRRLRTQPTKEEVVAYIEVKSTTSNDRRDFELSIRELLLAARYGAAYKVYRVYGASASPMRRMRFHVYEDLTSLWYTGKMTITGNVRAAPA